MCSIEKVEWCYEKIIKNNHIKITFCTNRTPVYFVKYINTPLGGKSHLTIGRFPLKSFQRSHINFGHSIGLN